MAEEVKQALKEKASAEASLKTIERQAEDLRKELHYCEINLATENQLVKDLREEIHKAKEAVQLLNEAAEAEKQAAYALGVQETQSRLTEEFSSVARDYCDITWGKALDAAGIPADSRLRLPESSQVLALLPPSSLPKYLRLLQQIKFLLLLWKFQLTLAKEKS